jgi:hypothetical protein
VRKRIYFKLKNFDRLAKEQRAVFYITYFPRGSRLLQTSMGGLLTGGRLGAAEKWIKAISLKYLNLPLIGQLCGKLEALLWKAMWKIQAWPF